MSDDSPEDRQRVFSRIAPLIMEFRGTCEVFHAEELRNFVRKRVPETAPGSPDRILRELRLRGWLDYQVVNRHQSLYQFIAPEEEEPMDDCVEPYRECVRSRQDRVRRAIEDNPKASKSDLAKLAGVSQRTIQHVRNSTPGMGEKAFSPPDTVKLKDLYDPNTLCWDEPPVSTIENALERCKPDELAYVLDVLFPTFKDHLKRRIINDRRKSANGAAQSNSVANGT